VLHEYEGSSDGERREGVEIIGLGLEAEGGAFVSAWVDTFHMGSDVMLSRGGEAPGGFSVLGSYSDPSGGPAVGLADANGGRGSKSPRDHGVQQSAGRTGGEGGRNCLHAARRLTSRRAAELSPACRSGQRLPCAESPPVGLAKPVSNAYTGGTGLADDVEQRLQYVLASVFGYY
jgi:hypothetical protein